MGWSASLSVSRFVRLVFLSVAAVSIGPGTTTASLYDDADSNVQVFTKQSDFTKRVVQSDGILMVQFFAPWCGHCKGLVSTYHQVADIGKGVVHVAAVDATSPGGTRISATYGVEGFPTMYVFRPDKEMPELYEGPREIQDMVQTMLHTVHEVLSARDNSPTDNKNGKGQQQQQQQHQQQQQQQKPSKVVEVTGANYQELVMDNPQVSMIAFVAPWCGHCQALVPELETAARSIDGEDAFLGFVDATKEEGLAAAFEVHGYPTIKVFPGGPKTKDSAMDYNGERTSASIVQHLLEEVDRSGVPKEIVEMTSISVLEEHCQGTNQLCVLAALPHILDSGAAGRNKYKDLIASVSKTFRGSSASFHFLWFEGTSQPELESSLELTFGFPAVVALSLDKQAYAVLRGSFDQKSIASFLHKITSGRQATTKLPKGIPEIVTIEPWDGQDGALPEEEMSLDEIMGWGEDEEEGGEL